MKSRVLLNPFRAAHGFEGESRGLSQDGEPMPLVDAQRAVQYALGAVPGIEAGAKRPLKTLHLFKETLKFWLPVWPACRRRRNLNPNPGGRDALERAFYAPGAAQDQLVVPGSPENLRPFQPITVIIQFDRS